MTATDGTALTGERSDLLETLTKHRYLLRFTVRDLTDEQAAQRTTASGLCLGGLIKHVTGTEQRWVNFALGDITLHDVQLETGEKLRLSAQFGS